MNYYTDPICGNAVSVQNPVGPEPLLNLLYKPLDMPLRFGLVIPQGWKHDLPDQDPVDQFRLMVKVAREAEELGYHSIWLYDHLVTYPKPSGFSTFECWTTLAALATATRKVGLGQLVTCQSYRNPALLAKMAATLDVVSGGRLEFGLGAGWYEEEYKAYGYEFPSAGVRIAQLEEAAHIMRLLWTEGEATFRGRYYRVERAYCSPKPVQKPHPPILIGGRGDRLLRVVARVADRSNLPLSLSLEECRERLGYLNRLLREEGRAEGFEHTLHREVVIERSGDRARERAEREAPSWMTREKFLASAVIGSPDECIETLRRYEEAGFSLIILYFKDAGELESVRLFAQEVLPALQE
jgi:F420-dependent oxidoreductase-like protein